MRSLYKIYTKDIILNNRECTAMNIVAINCNVTLEELEHCDAKIFSYGANVLFKSSRNCEFDFSSCDIMSKLNCDRIHASSVHIDGEFSEVTLNISMSSFGRLSHKCMIKYLRIVELYNTDFVLDAIIEHISIHNARRSAVFIYDLDNINMIIKCSRFTKIENSSMSIMGTLLCDDPVKFYNIKYSDISFSSIMHAYDIDISNEKSCINMRNGLENIGALCHIDPCKYNFTYAI